MQNNESVRMKRIYKEFVNFFIKCCCFLFFIIIMVCVYKIVIRSNVKEDLIKMKR